MTAIGERAVAAAADVIATVRTRFPEASLEGPSAAEPKELGWKVSGLTIQADWIGSNAESFGCQPADTSVASNWAEACGCAKHAVAKAGLHHAEPRAKAAIVTTATLPGKMRDGNA